MAISRHKPVTAIKFLGHLPEMFILGSRDRVGLNNLYTGFSRDASLAFMVTIKKDIFGDSWRSRGYQIIYHFWVR